MKNLFLFAATFFCFNTAWAMHGYGTDTCITKTASGRRLTIQLSNGQPVDPHRIATNGLPDGLEDQFLPVSWDQSADSQDMPVDQSVLVLKLKSTKRFSSKKTSDGCFEGESWIERRSAEVVSVDPRIARLFGLAAGQSLRFACREAYSTPTGKRCDY